MKGSARALDQPEDLEREATPRRRRPKNRCAVATPRSLPTRLEGNASGMASRRSSQPHPRQLREFTKIFSPARRNARALRGGAHESGHVDGPFTTIAKPIQLVVVIIEGLSANGAGLSRIRGLETITSSGDSLSSVFHDALPWRGRFCLPKEGFQEADGIVRKRLGHFPPAAVSRSEWGDLAASVFVSPCVRRAIGRGSCPPAHGFRRVRVDCPPRRRRHPARHNRRRCRSRNIARKY